MENEIKKIKNGLKTTEFYLASFVTLLGAVIQFLPASTVPTAGKTVGIITALLSALGYTASRTSIKNN